MSTGWDETRAKKKGARRMQVGEGHAGMRCAAGHAGGVRAFPNTGDPCPEKGCGRPLGAAEAWVLRRIGDGFLEAYEVVLERVYVAG